MKALSLYQPWATLVVLGRKRCETRDLGSTRSIAVCYRLIHAARTFLPSCGNYAGRIGCNVCWPALGLHDESELPRGMLLGTVQLFACNVYTEDVDVDAIERDRASAGRLRSGTPGLACWSKPAALAVAGALPRPAGRV